MSYEAGGIEERRFNSETTEITIDPFIRNKKSFVGGGVKQFDRDKAKNVIHITFSDPTGQSYQMTTDFAPDY